MASRKSHARNRRTAPRGGGTAPARSAGRSKIRKPGIQPHRSNGSGSADPKSSFDRYMALARAAAASGDAVQSENYYQHAEHYLRLMKETTA